MLTDVTKLTQSVFSNFIPTDTPIASKLQLYRLYRALLEVVENTNLVAEHYLALDFSEPFLESSSFGIPADKWRFFLNKDLIELNSAVKRYLQLLNAVAPMGEDGITQSYLSQKYNSLGYYGFIRDEYSVGYLDAASFTLRITQLMPEHTDSNKRYFANHLKIELDTFEKRETLRVHLREIKTELQEQLNHLKSYIKRHISLEDLL
jgi:hypothetical protein